MKTNQNLNLNLGLVKSLNPTLKSKKDKPSSNKSETISKYFSSEESCATKNSKELDSPFKKSLQEIKYVPLNEDASCDFQTPKPIKIQKKIQVKNTIPKEQNKKSSKLKSKSKASLKNNYILKCTKDNLSLTDTNPDHLQMALALSKSTYEAESSKASSSITDGPVFLTPDKIPKGKTTLDRFGFKWNKHRFELESRRISTAVSKRNKTSKFRFITPTLKSRTSEERESIIVSKITLILCGNKSLSIESTENSEELYSDVLREFQGRYSIFASSGYSVSENKEQYYTKTLNISPCKSHCGCLLKEWENIPGREKSPVRTQHSSVNKTVPDVTNISSNLVSSTTNLKTNVQRIVTNTPNATTLRLFKSLSSENLSTRDCTSPDLFEYESDQEITTKTPENDKQFSRSLVSPSKKQKSLLNSESFTKKFKDTCMIDEEGSVLSILQEPMRFPDNEDKEEPYLKSMQTEDVAVDLKENSASPKSKESAKRIQTSSNKDSNNEMKLENIDFFIDLTTHSNSNDSTKCTNQEFRTLNANKDLGIDTNFSISSLHLKYSESITEDDKFPEVINNGFSTTFVEQMEDKPGNHTSLLNVTDYVHQILNQNNSKIGEDTDALNESNIINEFYTSINKDNQIDDDDELKFSQESFSQESIVISDEELNYSSVQSNNMKSENFYCLSDAEDIAETNVEIMDIDEINNMHAVLKNKYRKFVVPIHNRVSELRSNTPLKRTSLTTELLEDSFNDMLDDTKVLKTLDQKIEEPMMEKSEQAHSNIDITSTITGIKSTDDNVTPEKSLNFVVVPGANDGTPKNNLIIKTKNITPLPNYDEMDTPTITRELYKYGLKPLKRQRGVTLLKYLYECTHPFLGPSEPQESSSDEENLRLTKRRRKSIENKTKNIDYVKRDWGGIEIVGDVLFKNENLNELIFERKVSVKIQSCRIPLQIVWHNFLSVNAEIKENLLLYEPLQLEVLHGMIKEQSGCKFHIQDLLTFFDKKCITIRTVQGSQRSKQKN